MVRGAVLIMDDDAGCCSYLRDLLTFFGYEAEAVSSTREAIDRLQNRKFSALLLDYYMPDIPGGEVMEWLRQQGRHEPVIMMSGMADYEMLIELVGKGATDLLSKPVQPSQLKKALEIVMTSREEPVR